MEFYECETAFVTESDSVDDVLSQFTEFEGCETCEKYKDASEEKKRQHIRGFHGNLVSYKLLDGRTAYTLPCRKGCMMRSGGNVTRSHYHCPFCGKMCGRKGNISYHFKSKCNYSKRPSAAVTLPRRDTVLTITEKRLSEWIAEQRSSGKPIDVSSLQVKAKELYTKARSDLGFQNTKPFHGGKLWLKRFLQRYGMEDKVVLALSMDEESNVVSLPAAERKDVILQIIDEVKKKPSLFDPLLATLEDMNPEQEAVVWGDIAKAVGLESGDVVKHIWKILEKKYGNRQKPGSRSTGVWEYEKHLDFLPVTITLEESAPNGCSDELQEGSIEGGDSNTQELFTVSIEGDESDFGTALNSAVEVSAGADDQLTRKIRLAKLRKVQLEMDTIRKEHRAKMEVLQMQKRVLVKKLKAHVSV